MSAGGPRNVPENEIQEGTGAKDHVAPVGEIRQESVDFMTIYNGLPERDRAKFARELLKRQPEQMAAARKKRRDTIRLVITVILVVAVISEAAVAVILTQTKGISWDHMKDWLTLSLAPLVAAMAVAAAFWFPSQEAE